MTEEEKKELKKELESCNSLYGMLVFLNKKYELKEAKISFLIRPKIMEGLIKAIEFTKPPLKQ